MNFFFPPQPTRLWPNAQFFEQLSCDSNYDAEVKYNGWRLEIHVDPKSLIFYNRHGTIINIDSNLFSHKFENIPYESVFDGELINFRTTNIKNIIIIWDCMFWNGKDLRHLPLEERRTYLPWKRKPKNLITKPKGQVYKTTQKTRKLIEFYETIVAKNDPLEEGIVVKNKKSKYEFSIKSKFETSHWYKIKKIGDHSLVEKS